MIAIRNITVTDRASSRLREQLARVRPKQGDVVALLYMSRFVNKDGSVVDGFKPGYSAGPIQGGEFGDIWAMAHLPDGFTFRFMPKFEWRADESYVVDLASNYTFSIEPVST